MKEPVKVVCPRCGATHVPDGSYYCSFTCEMMADADGPKGRPGRLANIPRKTVWDKAKHP